MGNGIMWESLHLHTPVSATVSPVFLCIYFMDSGLPFKFLIHPVLTSTYCERLGSNFNFVNMYVQLY